MNSIENVFRPAFEEIARRSAAPKGSNANTTTYFERSTNATLTPYELSDQDFVLMSMGTDVLAPRPLDPTRPSVRVYGSFPTREDAVDHASVLSER